MNRTVILSALLILIIFSPVCQGFNLEEFSYEFSQKLDVEELWEEWLEPDQYMTMICPEGNIIMQTARRIYEDDEYLTSDNKLYRVVKIEGNLPIQSYGRSGLNRRVLLCGRFEKPLD